MDRVKRERSANFTIEERDLLASLVIKYQEIIENKKSDATTWQKKESTWVQIASEFNARSGGAHRTSKTLRVKYEGLKRTVRKKSAALRSEIYRTGGGRNTAMPLDSTEEKIKSLISLTTDGLESIFDSDMIPQTQETDVLSDEIMEKFTIIPTIMDVESESTKNIMSIKEDMLAEKEDNMMNNKDVPLTADVINKAMEIAEPPTDSNTTTFKNDNNIAQDVNNLDTPYRNLYNQTPSTSLKWDNTSRKNLKTRRHPALAGNFQKRSIITDEISQAKLELLQLQKQLIEKEIKVKEKEQNFQEKQQKWIEEEHKKESEFKDKQRQWLEEEHKLKLQNLKNNK